MTQGAGKGAAAAGLAGDEALRRAARAWFEALAGRLAAAFEAIEGEGEGAGRFERRPWRRPGGGGGTMALMRGRVFEKVGVNVSTVWGELDPAFRAEIPGTAAGDGRFWASGLSLVAHMRSPHVPGAHMNTRAIATAGKAWLGGGADLNPPLPIAGDTRDFHAALAACCGRHACADHGRFKAWADDYFFIRHRGQPRGVGGIFFDGLAADEARFAFLRDVGETFLAIFPALVRRRMAKPWSAAERQRQLLWRGRYAEFNLAIDRGTRFGLMTGADPEAVLMSLPPLAAWP